MSDGMEEKPASDLTPSAGGQGGGLFEDRGHVRGDAILIRRWAGTVDPEKVKPLIEKGYQLAELADDERGWARVMDVLHKYAKLEQDETNGEPEPAGVTVNIQNNDYRNMDDRRAEFNSILAAALERARKAETGGAIDAAADAIAAVPPTAID